MEGSIQCCLCSGIPLEGEAHAPRALFSDCGLKYHCETPIPEIPKDFKEHPDRDIVSVSGTLPSPYNNPLHYYR